MGMLQKFVFFSSPFSSAMCFYLFLSKNHNFLHPGKLAVNSHFCCLPTFLKKQELAVCCARGNGTVITLTEKVCGDYSLFIIFLFFHLLKYSVKWVHRLHSYQNMCAKAVVSNFLP